ncbi:MAG: hypothetical protein ACI86M_003671 [Saprospiraceae bacterium]|jgi:hypothetical protein
MCEDMKFKINILQFLKWNPFSGSFDKEYASKHKRKVLLTLL